MLKTVYGKAALRIEDTPLGSGGEGDVYRVTEPQQHRGDVAKLLKPDKIDPSRADTRERLKKLEYLIANPPVLMNQHSVIWPSDLVEEHGRFCGYVMPTAVKGQKLTILTLPDIKRKYQQDWGRFDHKRPGSESLRIKLCFNIAAALSQIHAAKRYVLVDLKPDNILVEPSTGQISIIDIDSVEVYEGSKVLFRAPVSTPEYSPPEIATLDTISGFIPESWDRFSFGVIFYQILFGIHPFAGTCKAPYDNLTEISQMIERGMFVHGSNKDKFASIPPLHNKFFEYPQDLRQLFLDCFESGHRNPNLRPDINAWCKVLERYLQNLPLNPPIAPMAAQAKPVRYNKTQVIQTKRPVVPQNNAQRNRFAGANAPQSPAGNQTAPRNTRYVQGSSKPSKPFNHTILRKTQNYAQASVNLRRKQTQKVVKKRYIVFLGKRYELTPIINTGLYISAAIVVAVFFTGLYVKSMSQRVTTSRPTSDLSQPLGSVFVRDLGSGSVTEMAPDDITRQTAALESNTKDGVTDAKIYDFSMYHAEEYTRNENRISDIIDNHIVKQVYGNDNVVGRLSGHLIYTIDKNRQIRLQISSLEGTILFNEELKKKLIGINFTPVDEGGSLKIARAEYTFDKQVNSAVHSIDFRYVDGGIVLPKGGNDVSLKKVLLSKMQADNAKSGQYTCKYQDVFIDSDRTVVVLKTEGSTK